MPMLVTLVQFSFGLLSSTACFYQLKYNKLHQSVYGLSYDVFVLDLFANTLSIYSTLNYMWSPLTKSQFSKRFPLFYPSNKTSTIPISVLLVIRDVVQLATGALMLRQLLTYRSTKNINQGISTTCTVLIAIVLSFALFTYACSCYNLPASASGRFGIFYIEHVNYLWVVANIIQSIKYIPQLCLNWMGLCTKGVSSKYVLLSLLSEAAVALVSNILLRGTDFYKKPFNLTPTFVVFCRLLCLSVIFYQAEYLYLGRKPYLPRRK